MPQPGRLVREQREGRRVRLREAEAGEADELVEDRVRNLLADAPCDRALDEAAAERLDRLQRALSAHRAAQPLGLADREAGERRGDREHLILEHDHPERLAQRLLQQRMVARRHELRVLTQLLAVVDERVHRAALDRAGPDERDLDRQVLEVLGPGAQERLHLRAALDLEDADGVRALDLRVDGLVLQRDPRQVDRLVMLARDLLDAVLDRREHPQPEQVDLQEAGVGARVLVPLAELPPLHRGRLHRDELDQRARRDHHPARVLRQVARQAADLAAQLGEGSPARRVELRLAVGQLRQLLANPARAPVGEPRQPLELCERQPERLADVADRPSRAVGRERGDQRGVLAPVALAHRDDQLLADVAREVEVDVGHRDELAVDEAAQRQAGPHRVDVREAGQVADDRADRAPAAAARRKDVARDGAAANLERALARQLEHLPVQEEEAGEAELADQLQLLVEPLARAALVPVGVAVPLLEGAVADAARAAGSRARRSRRNRGSGSRGPRSGRTRAAPRARRPAPRRRGRAGSAPPAPRARPERSRGCRAAPARSRPARFGGGSPRARPGARSGADGARADRRSRPSGRRGPQRDPAARRCGARRRARTAAGARRRSAPARRPAPAPRRRSGCAPRARAARSRRGRRAPRSALRAAQDRAQAATARFRPAFAHGPRSAAGTGSRSPGRSRPAASRASGLPASPPRR